MHESSVIYEHQIMILEPVQLLVKMRDAEMDLRNDQTVSSVMMVIL